MRLLLVDPEGIAAPVFAEQEVAERRMMEAKRSAVILWDIEDGMQLIQCAMNTLYRYLEQLSQRRCGKR
jgi:hypothetical protein